MQRVPLVEDLVPVNAGRPGGPFGNLETTVSSDEWNFPSQKNKIKQN